MVETRFRTGGRHADETEIHGDHCQRNDPKRTPITSAGLVESVATISLDNALANAEDNIQIVSVKSEGGGDDDEDELTKPPSDDELLEQYDDLNDLLDKI